MRGMFMFMFTLINVCDVVVEISGWQCGKRERKDGSRMANISAIFPLFNMGVKPEAAYGVHLSIVICYRCKGH